MMRVRKGQWVVLGRGKCVGFKSYIPKNLGELINYHLLGLKYKTIWEQGRKRTTRLATYDDIIKDVHEYP